MKIFGSPNFKRLERKAKTKRLSKLLFSDDKKIVDDASQVLINLGEKSIPKLVSLLWKPENSYVDKQKMEFIRQKVMLIMQGIGQACVEPVLELLNHNWGSQAMLGARTLGIIGHPDAVPHLIKSLHSEKWQQFRILCAESLGKIGGKEALDALIYSLGHDSFGKVRVAAATALGHIGDPSAVEALQKAYDFGYSEALNAISMIKIKNKQE